MSVKLKGGMFLYFDKQGNLKEQINDTPLRQGNSGVNKIYVFWEEGDNDKIIGLWSRYTRAERTTLVNVPSATTYFNSYTVVNGEIPFNDKRDLKYFKYYQEYKFYCIEIPEEVMGTGNTAGTTWLCSLWFVLDKDNTTQNNHLVINPDNSVSGYGENEVDIFAMGGIAFYVIPSGLSIAPDENINVAQWNYLMGSLSYLQRVFEGGIGGLGENIKTFNGIATDKTGVAFTNNSENAGETDYIVKIGGEYYNVVFQDKNKGLISFNSIINDLGSKAEASVMNTFAKSLVVSMDSSNYKISFTLKDANNNVISTQEIDLPLESVVVSGSYDSQTQSIVLTLQNGNTVSIPVSDLVSGLVSNAQLQIILQSYYTSTQIDVIADTKADKSTTYTKTQIDAIADTKADAVDSAFEYNTSNHYFMAIGNIGIGIGKIFEINDFSQILEASSNKTLKQQLDAKVNEVDNAFIKNSTTGIYEAKNSVDFKGNDIDGITDLTADGVFVKNIGYYDGGQNGVIDLLNDIDANGKTIENVFLINTKNIELDIADNGAIISASDEDVLKVDENQNITIGSDNTGGTLTFRTATNEIDLDTLISTINSKPNASDINSLASNKIDVVNVDGTALTKSVLNNVVSVNVDLSSYATNTNLKTYAKSLEVSMNTTTYVATFLLKDGDGNVLSTQTLDLPLESIITSATYYDTYTYGGTTYSKVIVLVLSTTATPTIIPVASLVSGLASQTDLNALTTRVGTLETNSAFTYREENDVDYYVSKGDIDLNTRGSILTVRDFRYITSSTDQKSLWLYLGENFQFKLYGSGENQNMKTINSTSLLGSGNINTIVPSYAGTQEIYNTDSNTFLALRVRSKQPTTSCIEFKGTLANIPVIMGSIGVKNINNTIKPIFIDSNNTIETIALLSDLAFTYDSSNTKYISKGNIDLNGNNIEGVNSIDLDTTNSAFIYANDENVLSVSQYNDIVIGSDNAGTLTFRTQSNEVDFDDLMTLLNAKANTTDALLKTDATTTSTANKVVMRDGAGNIEGNYLKSNWLYTSGATDNASWTDVYVNNGGWLYKRAKASFKSDLGIPSGTLTTKENLTPALKGTATNSTQPTWTFSVDLSTYQGLGVFTYGNCQNLINLYGLQSGTTYFAPAIFRTTGTTGTTGVSMGMIEYVYNNSTKRLTIDVLMWSGSGFIRPTQTQYNYTAYLFLVNLK